MTRPMFTDGDVGNPLWLIRNGKVIKAWIRDVTLDGRACCEQIWGGYTYEVFPYLDYEIDEYFWTYYAARKALAKRTEDQPCK